MQRGRFIYLAALAGALAMMGWSGRPANADVPGWTDQTFGDTEQGNASIDGNGVITIQGAGADTWEREDEFHIVYKPLKGDGSVTTKLLSAEEGNEWSKIGVMMRNDLENAAAAVMQVHMSTSHEGEALLRGVSDPDNGASGLGTTRMAKDEKMGRNGGELFPREFPVWLKIERRGNSLTGYHSTDGTLWTPITRPTPIAFKEEIVAGIFVCSHDDAALLTGTFDGNATVVGGTETLLKPEQALPVQPANVQALGGNNSVLLMWERVNHHGMEATGYNVYKGPAEDEQDIEFSDFTKIAELAGDKTSYVDETIKNGELAKYIITTVVQVGDKKLESAPVTNKMLQVTATPDAPIKIGDRDYYGSHLDAGSADAYNSTPGSTVADATGVVTLNAAGWDIQEQSDGGHQLVTPVNGDFTFTARVLGPPEVDGGEANEWAKFGIQVRETTLAESRYAAMLVTPLHGIRAPHRRAFTNGWSDDLGPQDEIPYPVHLRIQRKGDEISMFTSQDGTTFTPYGEPDKTTLPNLPATVQVGLLGTSHEDGTVAQTRFDQITLTTP
jgi:regulation of enolase protein 1 (concanavalin A-like superfamily)